MILLLATIPILTAEQYAAFAAGIQAVVVVAALNVAAITYRGDSKNKRVDRVYSLHQELTTGEVNDARRRLAQHLRAHHPKDHSVLRVSRSELRETPLNVYTGTGAIDPTPSRDAALLLRFFQRARIVQLAGSADEPVFAELIGRHAGWWNCAFKTDASSARENLMALGVWADKFATDARNMNRYSYLAGWEDTRWDDFGALRPWLDDESSKHW